jgi:protein O-GlcNAc transferase
VDLALHMDSNRLLVFARKPAPIQVTFAGYPGSTGLTTIDYRLTDPYLDPPGLFDAWHSEKSVRLPNSFWCYDPRGNEPLVNELPALKNGYLTFGCLNHFSKVNDPILIIWASVLRAIPSSRLLLLAFQGRHREHVIDVLKKEGITRDRITFFAPVPRRQYLELYHRIDVGLDTLPYNGHTTSLDSLWMGVPVLTLAGQTVVGRAGYSQLRNLELYHFNASAPEALVNIAVELADNLPRLSQLRDTLRARMQSSILMDAPNFTCAIETAYRTMWYRWCADHQ